MRAHYDLDFKKMKPNRFALRPKLGRVRSVILEPDVAEVFHSSDDVNAFLRSAIKPGQAQRPCPHAERRRKLRRSAQAERGTGDGSDGRGKQRSDRGLARRLWRTGGWGRMGSGLRMGGWGRVFGPTLERSEKTVHGKRLSSSFSLSGVSAASESSFRGGGTPASACVASPFESHRGALPGGHH